MSEGRYVVYTPFGTSQWKKIFSADSVMKEGGAVEQLESVVKTGQDARVAVVLDTGKNRHVPIFRVNVNNRVIIQPAPGGWKKGDCGILNNTVEDTMLRVSEQLTTDLQNAPHDEPSSEESVVDTDRYTYTGQPDFVVLNVHGTEQNAQYTYVIPAPTQKQYNVLTVAHGLSASDELTAREHAALSRVVGAITQSDEHPTWSGIWSDYEYTTSSGDSPLRFEDNKVELVTIII